MGLLNKIRFGCKMIAAYNNWWLCFLEHFRLLQAKEVTYRLRNGMKLRGRPYTFDFGIINEVVLNNEYGRLMHHITTGSTVIDIGGQIGSFSILAARRAKEITVHAFEPFDENFLLLEKNIRLNKLQDSIIPHMVGIGAKKEKRTFYINKRRSGNHTLYKELYLKKLDKSPFREVTIGIISLKDVFDTYKIDRCHFMKIDCEGAEYEILMNAPKNVLKKIDSISLEYHANGDVNTLIQHLKDAGFEVTQGRKGQRILYCERR